MFSPPVASLTCGKSFLSFAHCLANPAPAIMALTLKFMNDQREAKWHAGELVVAEGDRAFKPSLMFVPAATLDQTFNELSTLWNGVLDVYSLYQSKLNCTNPTRQSVTIDTTQELQEMVDAWAAEADDPAVGSPSRPPRVREGCANGRADWPGACHHLLYDRDISHVQAGQGSTPDQRADEPNHEHEGHHEGRGGIPDRPAGADDDGDEPQTAEASESDRLIMEKLAAGFVKDRPKVLEGIYSTSLSPIRAAYGRRSGMALKISGPRGARTFDDGRHPGTYLER